jgi:valyl-tRNA synthetase
MFGLEFTGQPPFHTVYLHGLVRDGEGRKMSKTLGNVIDPREVMDNFGTDALRFTLLTAGTPGNDLNLSLQRVEDNRNFANKIWNMARFVTSNLEGPFLAYTSHNLKLSLADRWIIARLNETIASVTRLIEGYEFGQAGSQAYDFLWGDYADWYIEAAKVVLAGSDETAKAQTRGVLVHVLDMALRLLHPYVPYVTEAVWRHLPHAPTDPPALIVARWPKTAQVDEAALSEFGHVQELVRAIRKARADNNVEQKRRIPATIVAGDKAVWLASQRAVLVSLGRLDEPHFRILPEVPEKPRQAIAMVVGATEVYLPLEGLIDLSAERERLTKELADLDRQIQRTEGLLSSDFGTKAPAAVIERERTKLAGLAESRQKVAERLASMP